PISIRSANPLVETSAVRAPRPSSRALVPTVIPWVSDSTWSVWAPARRRTSSTTAITPSDWSDGVVGAFAVWRRSPSSRAASVKVPPTSTPRSIAGRYLRHGFAIRSRRYAAAQHKSLRPPAFAPQVERPLRRCQLRVGFEALLEVLVRRAVVPARQRLAPARGALAGAGEAVPRPAVEGDAVGQ